MSTTATSDRPASARLIVPRADSIRHLQKMLDRGGEIKAMRIRNGEDLDKGRGLKLEWTQDSIDLLNQLFDNTSVADYCNDWVGKIFPEYAEFGNFVEQFYEEMDYRLGKLRTVLKRVESAAESPSPSPLDPRAGSSAPPPSAVPGPMEPAMGAATGAGLKVLFVTHGPRDPAAEAVLQFMQQLSLAVLEADHTNGLIDTLESRNDAGFIVVMHGPSDGSIGESSMFKLGYCAGRLGMKRMCMMHSPVTAPTGEGHGVPHLAVDSNGGWQLHLAKQMKRAGLDVDLNRLC
jgi:hypothetical protein